MLLLVTLSMISNVLQLFNDGPKQLHSYDRASETLFSVSLFIINIIWFLYLCWWSGLLFITCFNKWFSYLYNTGLLSRWMQIDRIVYVMIEPIYVLVKRKSHIGQVWGTYVLLGPLHRLAYASVLDALSILIDSLCRLIMA